MYVPPTQGDYPDYSSSSEESSEIEGKPTKWNQHYVKYINKLQADLLRNNEKWLQINILLHFQFQVEIDN